MSTKESDKTKTNTSEDAQSLIETEEPHFQLFKYRIKRKTLIGYAAAIFCGVWGGSIMVNGSKLQFLRKGSTQDCK